MLCIVLALRVISPPNKKQDCEGIVTALKFVRVCCIRGYHVYRDVLEAAVGEELACEREPRNAHDRYAVAVKRWGVIIGHMICHESYRNYVRSFKTGRHDTLYNIFVVEIFCSGKYFECLIFIHC